MADPKIDFSVQAAILDKYIHSEDPKNDPVAVSVVTKRLKTSPDLQKYFFGQNPSSGWVEILYENGFFDSPPNVVTTEQGYQIPPWLISTYLSNVAEDSPQLVAKIVNEIQTNNPIVHADLIKALSNIPAEISVNFIDKVKNWVNNKYKWLGVVEGVLRLILHFDFSGYSSLSLDLIEELISPISEEGTAYGDFHLGGESKFKYDLSYVRPNFWNEILPKIEKSSPSEIIRILENNLILAIKQEFLAKGRQYNPSDWLAYGWRTSISENIKDHQKDYKDNLIASIRDALVRCIKSEPIKTQIFLEKYLTRDEIILQRIAIFLIAKHSSTYQKLVNGLLLDREIHRNRSIHNEYFELLSNGFSCISSDQRESVLELIIAGPDLNRSEELANKIGIKDDEISQYVKEHHDIWIRDRLWAIQSQLPSDILQILNNYIDIYGAPEHPELQTQSSGAFFIKEISPITIKEISNKSPLELLEYIKTWRPDPQRKIGPEEESIRGLSEATAEVFLDSSELYLEVFPKLIETPPLYTASIFTLAQERLKNTQTIPWSLLLDLAYQNAYLEYSQNENSWEDDNYATRIAVIRFILEAVSKDDAFPFEYLPNVEKTIVIYLSDPDPDEGRDNPPEGWLGYQDPITMALNSIRPLALEALMKLIILKAEYITTTRGSNTIQSISDILSEDALTVLGKKLDKSNDPSKAVHSVFGHYVWLLNKTDPNWFESKIQDIFPIEEDTEKEFFFDAAWEAYIVYNHPSKKLVDMLKRHYFYAIHLLAKGKISNTHLDYVGRLSNHIILEYLWSPYNLNMDSAGVNLLPALFFNCTSEIRSKAIWTLWNTVNDIPKDKLSIYWHSIKDIWKWRINELSLTMFPQEFQGEMEEFSYLPLLAPENEVLTSLWPLMLPLISFSGDSRVWINLEKFLANRVEDSPERVIKFYRLMHEDAQMSEFGYRSYGEEADRILITTVRDETTREDALKIMDIIYRRGIDRYKDTYLEYT